MDKDKEPLGRALKIYRKALTSIRNNKTDKEDAKTNRIVMRTLERVFGKEALLPSINSWADVIDAHCVFGASASIHPDNNGGLKGIYKYGIGSNVAAAVLQIAQLILHYDVPFTATEWADAGITKYVIRPISANEVKRPIYEVCAVQDRSEYQLLGFHSREAATRFLANNPELIDEYFALDY